MSEREMLSSNDAATLAAAFPGEHAGPATAAGRDATRRLFRQQHTERFAVAVGSGSVLIPARLRFRFERPWMVKSAAPWLFARALQTRSNDGFERQRAARDLLADLQPWGAPFAVALIGEYVVEILEDIAAAMTPEMERTIGAFIVRNPLFWNTIRQRVASYWNVYYRSQPRDEYVGFRLVRALDVAAARCGSAEMGCPSAA